ncbi:L,D-transpeptidase [Clostridium botulinum]|uniref:L,D-transpeptidase n=3 Tax=Clostridium botulinum TaxID=1491 RepID=A0A0A2HIY1_CLOBO|nr:L,D-transpeptidase [Clostridium botulinum]AJD28183.1 L,D-transpeptidase catalytic domain protein [Clostridium botulinum CDC_297]EPS46979.1 ErfK/YbiS/YcfS/YnhG family protein [Clostridium botulinum A1 str. CFSAN002368]ACO84260.1 ErfK/YbiS/YcfS/YnhG family protein [Clostridium botulinum A2 str. Kyoto]ACQ52247.1 ErfK/YbiS/YcfS/YnhG family protein [Clostridium botulinum Ba4 str. 657]AJE10434.1 L,D-transpeptidase catalytic domain protein [Clostridium botulinum CDC_1436]
MLYYLYPYNQSYRAIYRIVINTKAHTLTLFRNNNVYKTYKVAVGKPSTPTPKGTFKIINRAINPGGPFGARWLGLNIPYGDYGIHGTNNPSSIGKSVSNGCIRMFNNQVIELSNLVPIGTTVTIV